MRDFAERLIAYETTTTNFSNTKIPAACLAGEKLRPHLATLMGNIGFKALLSRALALAITGDKLAAEEAVRIGLIWQCVDDAALMDAALALAQRLAALPSKALAETRRTIDAAMSMDLPAALDQEARAQTTLGNAHDFTEGVAAFRAKRPALFKDR